MSDHDDDIEESRRYKKPWSARHPIPTISKYREEREARQQKAMEANDDDDDQGTPDDANRTGIEAVRAQGSDPAKPSQQGAKDGDNQDEPPKDTSEVDPSLEDPRQRRKLKKGTRKERAERQVTDPVTHLPVTIHDFTDEALKSVEFDDEPLEASTTTASGPKQEKKSSEQLQREARHAQKQHDALTNRFPPPDFDALKGELAKIAKQGVTFGLSGSAVVMAVVFALERLSRENKLSDAGGKTSYTGVALWITTAIVGAGALWALIAGVRNWTVNKLDNVFQDEVWEAQRRQMKEEADKHQTETTLWLNSLLGSVWPLINPDLFTSVSDTLEDVMQASLPKLVRMVSVEDIGQGSEALRILGVRWLPTGAAAHAVAEDGSLSQGQDGESGAKGNSGADSKDGDGSGGDDSSSENSIASGMEAEEGDFVNLEVAFAYRSRSESKSLAARTKDMHLYLAFYLPGNIKVPVWVDLEGILGTIRLRLQLTPDPPFFSLCTLTFLGQPKVNLSCVPLSKHGLNIMDVPFISNFVQSAVDAAMSEYVAPKSLTLDLKDMLAGDDFKKDTNAKGILVITIKRGYDFKMGDTAVPLIKDGSSDPYVSVGWAKFGKAISSTRILVSEMEPSWQETFFLLVTPEEINVAERLRVQLWDSDRMSADDDLGRIEVDLKKLMTNKESNGRMWDRSDGFRALKSGNNMPGKLDWSVGYYSKTRIQACQFEKQTYDPEVRSMDQLKEKVSENCERKLRETMFKEGQTERDESELEQQKTQELKTEQDAMIISAPPPDNYPSGIFSLQIHNITGLEVEQLSKNTSDKAPDSSDEEEEGEGLPSAYCTVIVNHHKTFKTRTKPQNAKPFFNAGCERFIRDWTDCEVYVAVRDARLHEDDALLGIVHLPLHDLFKDRAQVNGFWPLAGGIGHGRIRLSMVWRSVQLQAPASLLGWQYGTVEVQPTAMSADCPEDVKSAKLKFKTNLGFGKMYAHSHENKWQTKRDKNLSLAVQRRYSSCMSISFKKKAMFGHDLAAFCVLWLKDIPDEEEQDLELPIWKGDLERATSCCLDDCGEKIGTLKLKLTFWAGLGSAHSRWANGNQSLRDIVEVIDTARDNLEGDRMQRKAGIVDGDAGSESESDLDSESDSDSDDSSEDGEGGGAKKTDGVPDGSKGDKQGPIDQLRDYKRRDKGLHRQHRGAMQWKIPRTAKWIKHKFDSAEDKVQGAFGRSNREAGIETEV